MFSLSILLMLFIGGRNTGSGGFFLCTFFLIDCDIGVSGYNIAPNIFDPLYRHYNRSRLFDIRTTNIKTTCPLITIYMPTRPHIFSPVFKLVPINEFISDHKVSFFEVTISDIDILIGDKHRHIRYRFSVNVTPGSIYDIRIRFIDEYEMQLPSILADGFS